MPILEDLAYTAQTEISYINGEEYEHPGLLRILSKYLFIFSLGLSIILLWALWSGFQLVLYQQYFGFLPSVFAEIVLIVLRPEIKRSFPWEIQRWVNLHQWAHVGAILLAGAILLYLFLR